MSDDFRGKCGECRWWAISASYVNEFGVRERIASYHANNCRKHAPGPGKADPRYDSSAREWPATRADDWCGDHERYARPKLPSFPAPKVMRYVRANKSDWIC